MWRKKININNRKKDGSKFFIPNKLKKLDSLGFYKLEIFKEFKKKPLSLIDVGSRWGFSEIFKTIAPLIFATGFEPDLEEVKKIKAVENNFGNWNNFEIIPEALFDKECLLKLNITKNPNNSSIFKLDKKYYNRYKLNGFEVERIKEVKANSLDNLNKKRKDSNFGEIIQLDSQGSEYEIITGASDLIKKNTQCLICEISFFSPYAKTKGITKIFEIVEKLGLHFYSFLDFKFRSTKKIPKQTRIGRERIMQADAIFFKDPLFTLNNHGQRQVKINFLSALIFGFYDYCLELIELIEVKQKEKAFLEKLIFQLGNLDLNYIRNETKKFREALNEKNLNAILELGKIVDERRDLFSYDDLIKK